jgi:hypothetical protein
MRHRKIYSPGAVDDEDEDEDEYDDTADQDKHNPNTNTSTRTLSPVDKMHELISLQLFDGSWKPTLSIFALLGIKAEDAGFDSQNGRQVSPVPTLSTEADKHKHKFRITALALTWLRTTLPDQEAVWELVVEKAVTWLHAMVGAEEVGNLVREAEKVFVRGD